MTEKAAAGWISDNLTAIYGYAFARLFDKSQVDDLTQEIVCAVLASAPRCRTDEAFHGYAWKIAENTFRSFVRRTEVRESLEENECLQVPSAEQVFLDQAEKDRTLYCLRRELSLLAKTHREICVGYYIDHKRCSEIAKEQQISVEMVKYHLFKTRKLLKEGIGMTRQLGEKSYNPGTFRLDFWGDYNHYDNLFSRRLPGSVLLAAYYAPMTAEELSMELGVAMPYLEEELATLENAGVLLKNGAKYQTNLVILTDDYEKEFVRSIANTCREFSACVFESVVSLLPSIRKLDFQGNDYDDNRLLFLLLNIAMTEGYYRADERSPKGLAKPLPLGGNGWIFGYDNDYVHHHFLGVTLDNSKRDGTARFSFLGYRAVASCQQFCFADYAQKAEAFWHAILNESADPHNCVVQELIDGGFLGLKNGVLYTNFPVMTQTVYECVCQLLSPIIRMVSDCMIDISDRAEHLLREYVPASVKDQCGDIVKIHHRFDMAAFLIEMLIDDNKLMVPDEKIPLCVWGIKK